MVGGMLKNVMAASTNPSSILLTTSSDHSPAVMSDVVTMLYTR